jgi:membrane protein YdbS with pleckstrin-like domain
MYARLTAFLLRWLRVPPEPQPPHGDPASLQVFRAGRNFRNLRLLKWGVTQLAAMAGIIFWLGVFSDLEGKVEARRAENARRQAAVKAGTPTSAAPTRNIGETIDAKAKELAAEVEKKGKDTWRQKKKWRLIDNFYAWQHGTASFLSLLPSWTMFVIWFFEVAGIVLYVVQLPLTYLVARLEYELRWYMVTDRSLRIRHGVWKISESTMSFANIQQVVVSQGPFQRLLGLADVKVQSAGGGDAYGENKHGTEDDMHHGLFHSVTNAPEIRDLILDRLRRFRESGLGDPDEKSPAPQPPRAVPPTIDSADLLAAIRDLAAETRALCTVREELAHRPPA